MGGARFAAESMGGAQRVVNLEMEGGPDEGQPDKGMQLETFFSNVVNSVIDAQRNSISNPSYMRRLAPKP